MKKRNIKRWAWYSKAFPAKSPSENTQGILSLAVCVHDDHHPVLDGIGSLGNVSGGYVRFDKYMRGDFVRDIRRDWEYVSECLSKSMEEFKYI